MRRSGPASGRTEYLSYYLFALLAISGLSMAALSGATVFRNIDPKLSEILDYYWIRQKPPPAPPLDNGRASAKRINPRDPPIPEKDARQTLRDLAEQLEKLERRLGGAEYDVKQLYAEMRNRNSGIDWVAVATTIIGLIQGLFGLALAVFQWRHRRMSTRVAEII